MKRPLAVTVASIVVAGWLLRAWPALSFGDWWWVPVDYDDAVYFVSSAFLWRGEMPYRDFVTVQPPGLLLFLAPVSSLVGAIGAAEAFSLARWLTTLVGAASIALSARAAHRAAGPVAAIVAAACYAVFPAIVAQERSTYLEPVLNLACLLLANLWLGERVERRPRWALLAGLALGFALTVKLWAVVWAAACLVSSPSRRALGWLVAGAGIATAVLAAPFLVAAPSAFIEQTILFQIWRPPDGMAVGLERLPMILRFSWPIAALALAGFAAAAARRTEPEWRSARFFGAVWVLLVVAFLVSRTYWYEYDSHLAPAEAHLAGLAAASLWRIAAERRRLAHFAAAAVSLVAIGLPLRHCLEQARVGGNLMATIAATVRDSVPEQACYFAFEPAWGLAADRLPSTAGGRAPVVDVYGTMLLEARDPRSEDAPAQRALLSRAPQQRIRELLSGCEFLSLGQRGDLQLTPRTRAWIARRWTEMPATDATGIDLWRLRR